MRYNSVFAYIIIGSIFFAISRYCYKVAKAKGLDEQLAAVLTFVGLCLGVIPGLLVLLIYRTVKPKTNWIKV